MTFSVAGICDKTGMVGVSISSSSISVASRCPWVKAGVGAASTQNITDPSLGNVMLRLIEKGSTPEQAIEIVTNDRKFIDYRQLMVIDNKGRSSSFSGSNTLGTHAVAQGKHCIAAGNLLLNTEIPKAIVDSFTKHSNLHLAERLLIALQAGLEAGGEVGPIHSAGIKVAHKHPWPLVDLRVDWAEDMPIDKLMQLWRSYQEQMTDYNTRAIDPTIAPSYGVSGDL
ncbi:MAG: DUF1028 domain-containing protein [Anaerolineales bacterium]|nr:DUF1028 domain-containing protein [Anaerolineales bacterium]